MIQICLLLASLCAMVRATMEISATAPMNATQLFSIYSYANSPGWSAQDVGSDGTLDSTILTLPNPFNESFPSPSNPLLPLDPLQTIYRFQYIPINRNPGGASSPFEYVEVDWSTEGLPRGPNNSFVTPHFDFRFFLQTRNYLKNSVNCTQLSGPSIGRTCDPFLTSYKQMSKFLDVPETDYMPAQYYTDTGSAITQMGLHHLDKSMVYSVENVDLNPVVMYGSFAGDIIFLGAAMTAYAFQEVQQKGKMVWPIRPPRKVASSRYWPQTMALAFDNSSNLFTFELADMQYLQPKSNLASRTGFSMLSFITFTRIFVVTLLCL